jgi:glucokinase
MQIGLDIGGTNIKGVLMRGNCVVNKIRVATKSKTNQKIILGQIFKCIEILIKKNKNVGRPTSHINGIGIGVAGPVDFKNQKVLNPPNVTGLKGLYLGKLIKEKFTPYLGKGAGAIIEHDVNCFVLAEAVLGAGRKNKSVFGLTMGTGVGGGIVLNKKIYHGADDSAGEFGHMTIEKNGRLCKCGNKGCLEPYINDKGIKKTAEKIFGRRIETMRIFDDLAAKGDKRAIKLYRITGQYLGIGLANLVDAINPGVIIVGGGIMRAGKFILGPARKEMKKNILSLKARKTKLLKAKLGKFAGAIGAGLLNYGK